MNPLDQAIHFLTKVRPAVDGANGSGQTMGAACCCVHDFGLGESDAMLALRAWNETCDPPWDESELLHKVRDALKQAPKNSKPIGWRCRGARAGYRYEGRTGPPKPPPGQDKPQARVYELDDQATVPAPMADGTQKLLAAAFEQGEFIGIAKETTLEGKHRPVDSGVTLTREQWMEKLAKYDGDPTRFLGSTDGAFVRINPMKDRGSKDADVTALRHALLEFDSMPLEEQWALIVESRVPCSAVLYSGGRSVHAWVRVDAQTLEEYREAVEFLYKHFAHYKPDPKNGNPSRFSRLPGMVRHGKRQELLALRIGDSTFADWRQRKEDESIPEAESWLDKQLVPEDDPSVLIGPGRWLSRGNGVILNGPTGIGKSTLVATLCFAWALGRTYLGFKPLRPLKILIVQAEDDDGDLAEMKEGALHALGNLTEADRTKLRQNVRILTERALTGPHFIQKLLRVAVRRYKPDLIVLNPLSAYFGADLNRQEAVAAFFRNALNPILAEFNCCIWVIHHTPKPTKERKQMQAGELAYSGSGSADLANWARESMDLRPIKGGLFELSVTKRWRRLSWVGSDGRLQASRTLAYGLEGKLYWRDANLTDLAETGVETCTEEGILQLIPDEGIDKINLVELAKATFEVSPKTIDRKIKDMLLKKRRKVLGVIQEATLLEKTLRQRHEVYPDAGPRERAPVTWIRRTYSLTNNQANPF